ncbi:MAG: DUF4252 domain-containing protein [Bacteroidaceae bacterium]
MTLLSVAISAQDFASRFLEERTDDTNLKCISISPKMMHEVLKIDVEKGNEDILDIISNLKSMQMLTANVEGKTYFEQAMDLLDKNNDRFEPFLSFKDKSEDYQIMVRKKKGSIVELVMLMHDKEHFIVINFTGIMSDEFIRKMAKSMNARRS